MEKKSLISTVAEIKDRVTQKSINQQDEVTVMMAMLNDPTYVVGVYKDAKKTSEYCPSADARELGANILHKTTKMNMAEASAQMSEYEFDKKDAASMIGIGKEFINTYLETGRKLGLGSRSNFSAELRMEDVEARKVVVPPTATGGEKKFTDIPAHRSIKSSSPCPKYLK